MTTLKRTVTLVLVAACVALVPLAAAASALGTRGAAVVVERGQPVEIAFAVDQSGFAAGFAESLTNAVQMAVEAQPSVRGFPIKVNLVDTPCGDVAADVAAATTIVANTKNVGVLGHVCSAGFEESLPVYEAAGVVVISGSATRDSLPAFGPTVFNRTAVADGDGGTAWHEAVLQLPSVAAWRDAYESRFGEPPMNLAELYYDAAGLLIRNMQEVSRVKRGELVIDRAALAEAVRRTTKYKGVTCVLSLEPATGNRLNDPAQLARCSSVVVERGQPVEIAFAVDQSGFAAGFAESLTNAVQMAVEAQPSVRGFPIKVNLVDTPCGDVAADVAAATTIVANTKNVGVLGHVCSAGFEESLPVYEAAGVVVISGSATRDSLPAFGPTVFNRTAVADGDGGTAWHEAVLQLPSVAAWRDAYESRFGEPPMNLAELYYDAAGLLIRNMQEVSRVKRGELVIDRAALAEAVRRTTKYKGVTCVLSLEPATGNRLNDPAQISRCAAG